MHNNRWSDLEYVLAVAAKGSLASAARLLSVNHSTVQRRVQAFEHQTNIKIFERLRSGYRLTPQGEMFLEAAQSIDTILDDLDRKIAGIDNSLDGPLLITTTDAIFPAFAEDISDLQDSYPNIVTNIVITADRLNLDQREADIAVRASDKPPSHLVGRRVCGLQLRIFAKRSIAEKMESKPLGRRNWLGLQYPITLSKAGEWMDANIPLDRVVARASSFIALKQLAEFGQGHVILPQHLGDESPELVRVPCDSDLPNIGLWLLSHPDVLHSQRVRTGTDFLYQALKNKRAKFEGG